MKTKLILLTLAAFLLLSSSAFAEYDTLWTRYTHNISRLMFNKDDSKILTHGSGGIIIFDTETSEQVHQLSGKGIYSDDGSMIVALRETNVDVYNADTYELIKTIPLSFHGTYYVEMLPNNNIIVSIGLGFVSFIDYNTGKLLHTINDFSSEQPLEMVAYTISKDSKYVIVSMWSPPKYEKGSLMFINTETYNIDFKLNKRFSLLTMSDDGKYLSFTNDDEENIAVSIMDVDSKEIIGNIPGNSAWLQSMSFSSDGNDIAISINDSEDGIKIYNLTTYKLVEHIKIQGNSGKMYFFTGIAYSSEDKYMVSAQGTRLFLFEQSNSSIKYDDSLFELLFPNPATNTVNLEYKILLPSEIQVVVTDSNGSEINKIRYGYFNAGNYIIQFDCSKLSNGIYFLTLTGKDFKRTYKMVKEG